MRAITKNVRYYDKILADKNATDFEIKKAINQLIEEITFLNSLNINEEFSNKDFEKFGVLEEKIELLKKKQAENDSLQELIDLKRENQLKKARKDKILKLLFDFLKIQIEKNIFEYSIDDIFDSIMKTENIDKICQFLVSNGFPECLDLCYLVDLINIVINKLKKIYKPEKPKVKSSNFANNYLTFLGVFNFLHNRITRVKR